MLISGKTVAEGGIDRGSFGRHLRWLRRRAGFTQEKLAERSGLSVDGIAALETGRRGWPHADTLRRLADGLDLATAERERLTEIVRARGRRARSHAAGPVAEPWAGTPPDPAEHFVGRERELAELQRHLWKTGHAAVHGLGGVGKTQLVVRYVHQRRADYPDGVYWLRAEQESSLVGDLCGLAWRLRLPERETARQERQIEAVLRWLSEHERWLLVLDNLEPTVVQWRPRGLPGHVVVTSRTPVWHPGLSLEPLALDVATRFLLERTGQANRAAADAVAETLGGLPLALEQAAAYLEVSGRDLAGYADLLRTRLLDLMEEGTPEDYPRPVATTWRISFERLEEERPSATALLRLCAFLASDDIPVSVLVTHACELPEELGATVADEVEFDRAVAAARRYSLLKRQGDGLSVHRLVQAVIRESAEPEQREAWLGAAVRLLCAGFPDRPEQHPERWTLCARLLSHVQAAAHLAVGPASEPAALAWLLDRTGTYLGGRAEFEEARPLLERALAIRARALGAEHPETAESLDHLGSLLINLGDMDAARPLLDRALAIRERERGPDHPETALSLNNLAVLLYRQGQLVDARALYERALDINERVLGPAHLLTIHNLVNLGGLLREQGELTAARPVLERALALCEQAMGANHPTTATTLNNLAHVFRDQHDPAAARPLLERSLAIYERVLGSDHPYTAAVLNNLSGVLREQGELGDAKRLAWRALRIQQRVLSPDHPDLASGHTNLALAFKAQGELSAARRHLEQALAVRERIKGPDDPQTVASRRALEEVERISAAG